MFSNTDIEYLKYLIKGYTNLNNFYKPTMESHGFLYWIFFALFIIWIASYINWSEIYLSIIPPLIIALPWIILIARDYIEYLKVNKIIKTLNNTAKINKNLQDFENRNFDIDSLLESIEDIENTYINLYQNKKDIIINNKKFLLFYKKQVDHFFQILVYFSTILNRKMNGQQKALKSAKSEVSKHITWTPEFDQISELQRARLDRQIEQFEELQRVLVKV